MIEEQGHSVPTTNTSPTAASLSSRDTKTDQDLDSIALQLGFDNRESVWSATARFLRASSVFKRALWAWLNHPTIALLACIMPNLVLVCVIIRPGWSWKSVMVMSLVFGFQVAWQAIMGFLGRRHRRNSA